MHFIAHRSTFTSCLLVLLVAGAASAQSPVKVPHPLPSELDVKTPAPVIDSGPFPSRVPVHSDVAPRITPSSKQAHNSGVRAQSTRPRFDHVFVSEPGEGTTWARGRDYKAAFAVDGATFVPFFGSKADADHPVRFALASARVGTTEIAVERNVAPVRDGDELSFARGPITERWELALDSLEQQFVVPAPGSSGDLVLEIGVETDLAPTNMPAGLAFTNELGRVNYGAATAIDSDGKRLAMTTTWTDGSIELRLDGESVASARFPIVVDPIVSTFAVDHSYTDDIAPDTAYDAASDSYIVVEEEAYSATDHDIFEFQIDAAGNTLFANYLEFTYADWRHPRVANNALAQNFLCVAAVTPVGGGQRAIRGALVNAQNNLIGPLFTISGNETGDKLNPDVGGDPALFGPTYYMVVWQRTYSSSDQDIHGRIVDPYGTMSGLVLVDNSSGTIDTYPSISKSDGHPPYPGQNWTIVWQRFHFGTQEQVWGAQYHWDGTLVHSTFPIDQGDDCLRPTVSSLLDGPDSDRPYMVAFQVRGQVQTDWDVLGAMFQGTQFLTGTVVTQQIPTATGSDDQITPCVDSDGEHFSMTWADLYPSGLGDYDVYVADIVYAGGYPNVVSADTFAYTTLQELEPRITSTYSGGGARRRYLGVWSVLDQFTAGAAHDVWGGLWDGGEGGFATPFCFGDGNGAACPCSNFGSAGNGCANSVNANGANLGYTGNPWVGNDSFTLLGTGMPNSTALYFQGTAPAGMSSGVVFGDGLRCVQGFTLRLGTKLNVGGASQLPEPGDPTISSHAVMPSSGTFYYYQAWYRNPASFCTSSTFNLTNGLRAVWAP